MTTPMNKKLNPVNTQDHSEVIGGHTPPTRKDDRCIELTYQGAQIDSRGFEVWCPARHNRIALCDGH